MTSYSTPSPLTWFRDIHYIYGLNQIFDQKTFAIKVNFVNRKATLSLRIFSIIVTFLWIFSRLFWHMNGNILLFFNDWLIQGCLLETTFASFFLIINSLTVGSYKHHYFVNLVKGRIFYYFFQNSLTFKHKNLKITEVMAIMKLQKLFKKCSTM